MNKISFDENDIHLSLLCKQDIAQVIHEGNSACLALKSVAEIQQISKQAQQHNPDTGFMMNTALNLACRIEMKIRSQAEEKNHA